MHKMTMYENLRDKVDSELADIEKVGITKENLDHLYKLSMSLKAIDKHLCMLAEEDGYSNNYYDEGVHGNSYARMKYSRNYYPYNYPMTKRYSRENAKMKMVNKLETLLDDTMSDSERMAIEDCINRINNK